MFSFKSVSKCLFDVITFVCFLTFAVMLEIPLCRGAVQWCDGLQAHGVRSRFHGLVPDHDVEEALDAPRGHTVPDDALVDDAVTAAGLRTWKKLWMLRTAPDDGLITRHRLHNVQQGRGQRTHNAQPRRRPSKGGDELHQNKGLGVSCWAARPLAYPPPLDGSL